MTNNTTKNLSKQISQNNKFAFRELFDIYYIKLCKYCNKYICDIESSRDIAQDIFSKIWDNRTNLANITDIEAYIFKMGKNKSLDFIKKNSSKDKYFDYVNRFNEQTYSEADKIEIAELEKIITSQINELPEKTKNIFQLKNFEQKKILDIADNLAISKQSVKWHLAKAKEFLKESIKKHYSN
jgi:RNA polymerase sigma-70 factor (ECF subfamily)